ncbi:MAG: anhydro-N-acetylmuramic acid kinase [Terriglobia bacterium]
MKPAAPRGRVDPGARAGRSRWAVGLMSGTSADGIDAALVEIQGSAERPRPRLKAFRTFPYPASLRDELLLLASGEAAPAGEISRLNFVLGGLFADAALAVCRQGGISPRRLAVIGSHGHTVFHQGRGREGRSKKIPASTLQIGEPGVIAERTGTTVVADFRTSDIAAGGEGAPLVPLVDHLLLGDAKLGSIALNLGGIANVTAIPAGARVEDVFGFDSGPGNMLLDGLARHFSHGRKLYDKGGRRASRGAVIQPLLNELLGGEFIRRRPPKSAGREQFGAAFLGRYFLARAKARPEDLLRTATEFTAQSVSRAVAQFVLPRASFHLVIVSGGGAHNAFLLERLGELLQPLRLLKSDDFGLPVDAKEAIAFALLADRTLHGLPGNLPAVTGARRAVVLGKLCRR